MVVLVNVRLQVYAHIAVIKFTVLTDLKKSPVSTLTCKMLKSYPSALIRRKAKQIKNYSEIRQRTEDARKTANPETGEMERNIK